MTNDFNYNSRDKHEKDINFYELDLENRHSFFITILNHFEQIYKSKVEITKEHQNFSNKEEVTPQVVVGRSDKADIRIHDQDNKNQMVSNRHLLLEYLDGSYYATDISRHGSSRNGKKMEKNVKVKIDIHDVFILADECTLHLTEYRDVFELINEGKKDFLMVGRDLNCDFVVLLEEGLEKGVSNEHLRIYLDKNKIFVEDNRSTNGSYFNERRMKPKEKISFNPFSDKLLLGDYEWTVKKNDILEKFQIKES